MGWGDMAIKRLISGLLISNCIAINEPKENPDIQHCEWSIFPFSIQSKAAAASDSSPCPLSNFPSLLPTPLKLIRQTENPFFKKVWKISKTIQEAGFLSLFRRSRGRDINASCGSLANKKA